MLDVFLELCLELLLRTHILLKLSVGCLAFLVVQLYKISENNSIEKQVEVNYHGRRGTVCDEYLDNNDAQVMCRVLGFKSCTALLGLGEQYYPKSC